MLGAICKYEDAEGLLFLSASLVSSAFHSIILSRHGKCDSPSGESLVEPEGDTEDSEFDKFRLCKRQMLMHVS